MDWMVDDFQACSPKITPLSTHPLQASAPLCACFFSLKACLCLSFEFVPPFFIPASVIYPLVCRKSLHMGPVSGCLVLLHVAPEPGS